MYYVVYEILFDMRPLFIFVFSFSSAVVSLSVFWIFGFVSTSMDDSSTETEQPTIWLENNKPKNNNENEK